MAARTAGSRYVLKSSNPDGYCGSVAVPPVRTGPAGRRVNVAASPGGGGRAASERSRCVNERSAEPARAYLCSCSGDSRWLISFMLNDEPVAPRL